MAQVDPGPVRILPSGANINPAKLPRLCWLVREDLAFIVLRELLERSFHLRSGVFLLFFFGVSHSRNNKNVMLHSIDKSNWKKNLPQIAKFVAIWLMVWKATAISIMNLFLFSNLFL